MSDAAAVQALQIEVAGSLYTTLSRSDWANGWSEAAASYIEAGSVSSGSVAVRRADGSPVRASRPPGNAHAKPWRALRAAMANPRDGAWLRSTLTVTSTGGFTFTFEYDRRPYDDPAGADPFTPRDAASLSPSDDDWREDFARYPRRADRTPAWAAELLEVDPDAGDPTEIFRKELAARPGFPRTLRKLDRDEGWRTVHESAGRHVREALLSGRWNRVASPDRRTRAVQLGGLLQEVLDTTLTEDLFPRRAGFLLDLWSAWAAIAKRPIPAGFGAIDRAAPIEEEMQGPLEDVGDDVTDVLGELIASDLTDRFGIAPQ